MNQRDSSQPSTEDATAMRRAIDASREALAAGDNPYGAPPVAVDGPLLADEALAVLHEAKARRGR